MHTVCFEKEVLKSFVSFFFVFKIFSFSTELSLLRKHTKNQMCTHYQGIHSFLAKLSDSEPALSHLRPAAELPEATGGSDVICLAQEARSAWPRQRGSSCEQWHHVQIRPIQQTRAKPRFPERYLREGLPVACQLLRAAAPGHTLVAPV